MNRSFSVWTSLVGIVFLATGGIAAPQAGGSRGAQMAAEGNYSVPRTPWGDPDLQGTYTSDDSLNVPTQRPEEYGERLFLTPEEYSERVEQQSARAENLFGEEFQDPDANIGTGPPSHWLELGDEFSRQTSLVIDPPDGRIPEMTPEGQARRSLGQFNVEGPGSWEEFTLYIRCITRGITGSIWPVIYGNGTRVIQGPGFVGIQNEMVHEARVIPLDDTPYVGDDIRMYMGDSRGRWDGDTLVVETRNLTGKTGVQVNGGGNRHTQDMVLTERFTRIGPDRLYYEATFDDPNTWTAPWTVGFPIVEKPAYDVFEYACHEGNNAMFNMLSGARADEAAAAAAGQN
jgi:hypothetical protein